MIGAHPSVEMLTMIKSSCTTTVHSGKLTIAIENTTCDHVTCLIVTLWQETNETFHCYISLLECISILDENSGGVRSNALPVFTRRSAYNIGCNDNDAM